MIKHEERTLREYKAIVWSKDPSSVGQHVTVSAYNATDAHEMIQAKYDTEIICSIWNEEDANAPR